MHNFGWNMTECSLSGDGSGDLARLRWRCRRGLLELDLVLEKFLKRDYPELDQEGRAGFERLLALPDMTLLAYVQGAQQPTELEWQDIVRKLRQ